MHIPVKKLISLLLLSVFLFSHRLCCAENKAALSGSINKVIAASSGKLGVAILGLDFRDSLFINGNSHFPMQSVFKFPLAMAVLDKIDRGAGLSLDQIIHIPRQKLDPATWSPMLRDFPAGDIDMAVSELLRYAIAKSDNNACDLLFELVGGTAYTHKYIRALGVKGISIVATEAEMKKDWNIQYTNWSTPAAMAQLLSVFYLGKKLKPASKALLMKWMTESENSPKRIKGQLPANAIVAHKTGTSNTNDAGVTAATNDVGIITLPDGRHIALVVFVSDYEGGVSPHGEKVIADISKLVWDYYTSR